MKQESLQDILNLFSFWDKDIFSYIKLYRETSEEIYLPEFFKALPLCKSGTANVPLTLFEAL